MRPESSNPTRTRWSCPRSWAEEMKCSRRSSVHFTVVDSARAAQATATSSGQGWLIFTPKAPPTSGVMTSMSVSAKPSLAARAARRPVLVWVEEWTTIVRSSEFHRAMTPLPSIGMHALRSISSSRSSTCGAESIAAAASPTVCTWWAATLSGVSSWTARAASRAAGSPTTGGRSS